MAKRKPKGSFIVTVRTTVTKSVICEDCTEEQARTDPFEHAVEENEMDQISWEVLKVEPNE